MSQADSGSAGGLSFITEQDIEKLQAIAEHGKNDPVDAGRDPTEAELEPGPTGRAKGFTRLQSRALFELSEKTTNAEAAAQVGVSERTVERHRAYWLDGEDQDAVKLEMTTRIDDRLCAAMRSACQDGETLAAVAEYFGVSRGAAFNHVSAAADFECSHDPPVELERVEFIHGGMRGNPDRRICEDCGRFTGRLEDHDCPE